VEAENYGTELWGMHGEGKIGKGNDNRDSHLVCKLFLVFLIPSREPGDCGIVCHPDGAVAVLVAVL